MVFIFSTTVVVEFVRPDGAFSVCIFVSVSNIIVYV